MFLSGILFTVCSISISAGKAHPIKAKSVSEKIDAHIIKYSKTEDFQGAVLVARKGKIIHKAAYGLRDREKKLQNTPDTQFLIGSLTKSFVSVTVMQLVEAGFLDLHAPVKKYIPELKDELAEGLTVHFLLKNQSGLAPSFDDLTDYEEWDVSPKELLEIINKTSRSFTPGTKYEYSNLNYTLCAIALEKVTGKKYSQILQERTFDPLKMSRSGVERLSNRPSGRAGGYRKKSTGIERDENVVSYAFGAGDIYSTAEDLFKWDQALHTGKLISGKSKKLIFASEGEKFGYYGYGFRIQEYQRGIGTKNRGTVVRHGGTMNGFMSNLHRYLDDELTVIILGNIRPFPIRNLTFEIKEIVLGFEPGTRNKLQWE